MLYLLYEDGTSPHTIGEVYIDKRWYVIDPANDMNVLMTRRELMKNKGVLRQQVKEALDCYETEDQRERFLEVYWNPALVVYEQCPM
jgi:hypothetical protein